MKSRQRRVIEAYQRVQGFLQAHPLSPPGDYGEPKQMLDDAVVRLTDHSREQVSGSRMRRAGRENETALRRVLREQHLRPITLIAQAQLEGSPGLEEALLMPAPTLPTIKLVAVAESFHRAVTPYESLFVRSGRPADFLAQLEAATQALQQALQSKERHLATQIGAGAGLNDEIVQGRRAIKMLEAIVRTSFPTANDVLAEWRSARRIRRPTGGNVLSRKTAEAATRKGGSITQAPAANPAPGTTPVEKLAEESVEKSAEGPTEKPVTPPAEMPVAVPVAPVAATTQAA